MDCLLEIVDEVEVWFLTRRCLGSVEDSLVSTLALCKKYILFVTVRSDCGYDNYIVSKPGYIESQSDDIPKLYIVSIHILNILHRTIITLCCQINYFCLFCAFRRHIFRISWPGFLSVMRVQLRKRLYDSFFSYYRYILYSIPRCISIKIAY